MHAPLGLVGVWFVGVQVSAGYSHTVVHDDRGGVFTFGQNDNGQLALGPAATGTAVLEDTATARRAAGLPAEGTRKV